MAAAGVALATGTLAGPVTISAAEVAAGPAGFAGTAGRVAVAVTFAVAAGAKLGDPNGLRRSLRLSRLGRFGERRIAPLVVPVEVGCAVGLVLPAVERPAAAVTAGVLLAFLGFLVDEARSGQGRRCACFGPTATTPGRGIARNLLLLALLAPSLSGWSPRHPVSVEGRLGLLGLGLAAGVAAWWDARRRVRVRAAAVPATEPPGTAVPVAVPVAGPVVPVPAPPFLVAAVQATGRAGDPLAWPAPATAADAGHGDGVGDGAGHGDGAGEPAAVVVFVEPGCPPCAEVVAWLTDRRRAAGLTVPVMVLAAGEATEVADWCRELGAGPVGVDPQGRVADAYGVRVTPSAVGVNRDGVLADAAGRPLAAVVAGREPVLALLAALHAPVAEDGPDGG